MSPGLALGAVMMNEWDFVLPWVAHHRQQGFGPLLVADNESDDGTLELLEALEEGGYLRLYRQPGREGGTQVPAYLSLLETLAHDVSVIGFIDADEFLVSHDDRPASVHLARVFDKPEVGAVAVNWRVFGSAGRRFRRPLGQPSTACAQPWHPLNGYFKSFARVPAIEAIEPHQVLLAAGYEYRHVDGSRASLFRTAEEALDGPFTAGATGIVARLVMDPVTIHHHALRDQTTFQLGKGARPRSHFTGDQGKWQETFYRKHDLNDDSCDAELRTLDERQRVEAEIVSTLTSSTNLLKRFRLRIDCDADGIIVQVVAIDGVNRAVRIEIRQDTGGWVPFMDVPVAEFDSGVATLRFPMSEISEDEPLTLRLKGVLDVTYA